MELVNLRFKNIKLKWNFQKKLNKIEIEIEQLKNTEIYSQRLQNN